MRSSQAKRRSRRVASWPSAPLDARRAPRSRSLASGARPAEAATTLATSAACSTWPIESRNLAATSSTSSAPEARRQAERRSANDGSGTSKMIVGTSASVNAALPERAHRITRSSRLASQRPIARAGPGSSCSTPPSATSPRSSAAISAASRSSCGIARGRGVDEHERPSGGGRDDAGRVGAGHEAAARASRARARRRARRRTRRGRADSASARTISMRRSGGVSARSTPSRNPISRWAACAPRSASGTDRVAVGDAQRAARAQARRCGRSTRARRRRRSPRPRAGARSAAGSAGAA